MKSDSYFVAVDSRKEYRLFQPPFWITLLVEEFPCLGIPKHIPLGKSKEAPKGPRTKGRLQPSSKGQTGNSEKIVR